MITTTAQTATTEVVYVIPLGWTVALGAVILLALGALIGAWLTTESLRVDEDRAARLEGALATLAATADAVGEDRSAASARKILEIERRLR